MRSLSLAFLVLAAIATAASGHAQTPLEGLTRPALPLVRPWADAVLRHRPGEIDSAALVTSAWSQEDVRHAWVYVQLLATLMREHDINAGKMKVVAAAGDAGVRMPPAELDALRAFAQKLRQVVAVDEFLKRAAMLHTDIVRFVAAESGDPSSNVSMLMPHRIIVEMDDGRQQSARNGAVHWELARVLLDQVEHAARDAFVHDWYRASMQYKLERAELDAPHFAHALRVFPRARGDSVSCRLPARGTRGSPRSGRPMADSHLPTRTAGG